MVVKLLLGGTEVSIINAYILYEENWKNNSKLMSHTEFRRQLAIVLRMTVKIVLHPPEDEHLTRNGD
jgi:hypothetical protein